MDFLHDTFEASLKKDWSDEDKQTLINFYSQHPSLWNHRLKDYHDKARRQVLLKELEEELSGSFRRKGTGCLLE